MLSCSYKPLKFYIMSKLILVSFINSHLTFFDETAKRNLPKRMQYLSEDIAQDSVIKCLNKIHQFAPSKGALKGWIYRIIQNECRDRIKAHDRLPRTEILDYKLAEEREEKLDQMEKLKIHKALSLLSDKDREIITLKILNNLSGRDISKIMGIPEEQVPMYTRRAKLRLRKIWKGMAA